MVVAGVGPPPPPWWGGRPPPTGLSYTALGGGGVLGPRIVMPLKRPITAQRILSEIPPPLLLFLNNLRSAPAHKPSSPPWECPFYMWSSSLQHCDACCARCTVLVTYDLGSCLQTTSASPTTISSHQKRITILCTDQVQRGEEGGVQITTNSVLSQSPEPSLFWLLGPGDCIPRRHSCQVGDQRPTR